MNTYTSLGDGVWGVSVDDGSATGDLVEVEKANGEIKRERLGGWVRDRWYQGRHYSVYEIVGRPAPRPQAPPPRSSPPPPRSSVQTLPASVALAYAVLGLTPPVTLADARRAHRDRCRLVHPDKGGSNTEAAAVNRALETVETHLGLGRAPF